MQISSVSDNLVVSTFSNAAVKRAAGSSLNATSASADAPTVTIKSKPEDYLTDGDVKMILYVSGASSLEEAELNPNAKNLAQSLGSKRENGYVQGDVSKGYWYSQLTDSDAKLIEGMTGKSNIIDAINSGDTGVMQLAQNIALDREDGSLKSDVSTDYLLQMKSSEEDEMAYAAAMGQSPEKATPAVPIEALLRAVSYVSGHVVSGQGLTAKA